MIKPHFILYVSDQNRSRDFYARLLGVEPRLDVPGMTEFTLGEGVVLGLMPEEAIVRLLGDAIPDPAKGQAPRAELYLLVQDSAVFHERALAAGATEVSPLSERNWGHRVAYVLDPDGHVVAFAETIAIGSTLESERLRLTPAVRGDAPLLCAMWRDESVRRFLWDDRLVGEEETRGLVDRSIESFASHRFGIWCVSDRAGDLVGFCALRPVGDAGDVEILYGLLPGSWGQGYATEAASTVLEFAFEDLGLPRVLAGTDPPNQRSIAVVQRLGMHPIPSPLPELDALYFAITREAWMRQR